MSDKPGINPRDTYVLDENTLEELDETSLTGVVRELSNTMRRSGLPSSDPDEGQEEELEQDQPATD